MTPSFKAAMSELKLGERAIQQTYADLVDQSLNQQGKLNLIQADTGVGKSLGYAVTAALKIAASKNARVIICSHTIALLNQLNGKDIPLAVKAVHALTGRVLKHAMFIGRNNYVSKERLDIAVNKMGTLPNSDLKAVDLLRNWTDTIDRFIEENGELPLDLTPSVICQTTSANSHSYEMIRTTALEADILLTSHAMLINDIFFSGQLFFAGGNSDRPTYLIVDEADQLHSQLIERQQIRYNLVNLRSDIDSFATPALLSKVETAFEWISSSADKHSFTTGTELQLNAAKRLHSIADGLRRYKRNETAQEIARGIKNNLSTGLYRFGIGVSPINEEPAFVFVNPYLSRVFAHYASSNYESTLLTSGTLSTFSEVGKGVRWLLTDLGIKDHQLGIVEEVSPQNFGSVRFTLAGDNFPKVFIYDSEDSVRLNPDWLQHVAQHINSLDGNVLILTSSHKEAGMLADRLSSVEVTIHTRGQCLSDAQREYLKKGGMFITAGGKSGMDIRNPDGTQFLSHVILTRIPFTPVDEVRKRELTAYLSNQTHFLNARTFVDKSLYAANLNNAIRDIKQSLGRGIRHEHDHVGFHLLDSRFPVHAEASTTFEPLKHAIPKRFRSAYQTADVLMPNIQEEISVW